MIIKAYRLGTPLSKEDIQGFQGLQAVDSTYLYGIGHVEYACSMAKRAIERGTNVSNDLFVQTIVALSAQRQINKAYTLFGLKGSEEVLLFGEEIPDGFEVRYGAEEMEISLGEKRIESLKKAFSLGPEELNAFPGDLESLMIDLIRERIALSQAGHL